MPEQNIVINNTVGGELSPRMFGRVDIPIYQKGLSLCQNFLVFPQGGASFRRGTVFVKNTHITQKAVFIPFQFNNSQSYLLELTNLVMTIYTNNGVVTETAKTINAITKANPGVLTMSAAHGLVVGDEVQISGIDGMTELNGQFFYVNSVPTTTTLTLKNIYGTAIDTTNFTTFTSGTNALRKVYKINTPYPESVLEELKFSQTGDTMFIYHNSFRTRLLTRTGETSWAFTIPNFGGGTGLNTTNPTTQPRCGTFSVDSRHILAGTPARPETVWGSKTPSQATGDTQFTNMGAPNLVDDIRVSDGFVYTLASVSGKVDYIEWIANTPKFMVIGTQGSVRRMYGDSEGSSPTPLAVNVRPVNNFGADKAIPVSIGSSFFYIERGSQRIRNLNYDFQIDAYDTTDMNLAADHISRNMKQIMFQSASPDVLWGVRNDGKFIGLSYQEKENVAGWHRHYMGGSHIDSLSITQPYAKVLWLGSMNRATKAEQIWFIVERRVNGATLRSVEYMSDEPAFPIETDFYTGNRTSDSTKFADATYEIQKDSNHLDSAIMYDGTQTTGTATPSAVSGNSITITASAATFTSNMVGRQIWKKYDSNGNGGGKATITGFTSSTVVTCSVIENFDNTNAIPSGQWMITTNKVYGAWHLEGQTVGVLLDGAPSPDLTISAGQATLPKQASKVVLGFRYTGIVQSLNLDFGGSTGSAQNKPRKINKIYTRFLNSIGMKIGTDLYALEQIDFPKGKLNRGTPMFSGVIKKQMFDKTSDDEKKFTIMQDQPLPCTVTAMDLFGETTDA